MQFKRLIAEFLQFLKDYRKYVFIHIAIFIVSIVIVCFDYTYNFSGVKVLNDFAEYYYSAKVVFQVGMTRIYDVTYMFTMYKADSFRSLLAVLGYFYFFTILPLVPSYVLYSLLALCIDLCTMFITLRTIKVLEGLTGEKTMVVERSRKYVMLFFVVIFFIEIYMQGQVIVYVALFSILGLYFFLKRNEIVGSLFLGISIVFKPVSIFVVLFLLLDRDLKKVLKRLIFVIIPLLPDLLIFTLNPLVRNNFISFNVAGFRSMYSFYPAISFSNLLIELTNLTSLQAMIIALAIALILGLALRRKMTNNPQKIFFAFIYGICLYFFVQADVWTSQLLALYPFLVMAFPFIEITYKKNFMVVFFFLYPVACEIGIFDYSMFFTGGAAINLILRIFICSLTILLVSMIARYFLAEKNVLGMLRVAI